MRNGADTNRDIFRPRMVSFPVINWATDGWAFGQALTQAIHNAGGPKTYDLIDAHFVYPDGVGAYLAGKKLGIPVSVTIRGKIVSLSRRALRRLQIARMLRHVDIRIAVSQSLADWVRRVAGSDLSVAVIPNGIDPSTFYPLNPAKCRKQLGWSPQGQFILSVGHMQKLKGFDRLLAIWPQVRKHNPNVRLILAGSLRGEKKFARSLQQAIAKMPDDSVRFVGPVDAHTLNLMYNGADLYVNASRSEGWCNAISEALAVGLPVVATDVGGNREQIDNPDLGCVVPDGDLDALAQTISACLNIEWNRTAIADHGQRRDWQQVARELLTTFEPIIGKTADNSCRIKTSPSPIELAPRSASADEIIPKQTVQAGGPTR